MASPFTRAVVSSMRSLYPELLADKSFDNTGLLLEAPFDPTRRNRNSLLLTIDLTRAVADEAIEGRHSIVVAYHPIIFRGLKALTLRNSQQESLLRLAANGISVYSPHTAVDIVPGGMADWLCDIVAGKLDSSTIKPGKSVPQSAFPETKQSTASSSANKSSKSSQPPSLEPIYPTTTSTAYPSIIPHSRRVITPSPASAIEASNNSSATSSSTSTPNSHYTTSNTGSGRLIHFNEPQPLSTLLTRIAQSTGSPSAISVAIPQRTPSLSLSEIQIRTVGLCPGSGSSVLSAASPPPDLLVTGEMSHHETLAVIERGGYVVSLFHSNSERGYLRAVMQERLREKVTVEWERVRKEGLGSSNGEAKGMDEVLRDESVDVVVSERDRDPFGIVLLQDGRIG